MSVTPGERAGGDVATDLAVALLLGVGVTCWTGLVAGQLRCFRAPVLGLLGLGVFLGVLVALRRPAGPSARWRSLDGAAVFVLAALLYLPGYDATLYGSDATVYLATGAHLARRGSLAIDDPLLREVPPALQAGLFPAYGPYLGLRHRSPAGLVFSPVDGGTVYSTFGKLPSVWLALGFAAGGIPGAVATTPLLGAGAVMAFFLLLRRTTGTAGALLAAGLLAPALPQFFFARLPLSEVGAQFFLWSGLLALSRWHETRGRLAGVAAGVGLGLAVLARPEHLVFLPLALALLWILGPPGGAGLPAVALALTALLAGHALLLLYMLPTHYRLEMGEAMSLVTGAALDHLAAVVLGAVIVATVTWALLGALHAPGMKRRGLATGTRALAAAAVVLWAVAYGQRAAMPAGTGLRWLPFYVGWPVVVLAVAGLPVLVRRWWREPSVRLALVVSGVAACHFLYDPHTAGYPLWGARRLVPAALPLLAAAAAAAAVAVARCGRVWALLLAAVALGSNLLPVRPLWGRPDFRGTSAAAAAIAAMLPADALTIVDPAIFPALLDVPLWLVHGREAIQLQGAAGMSDMVVPSLTGLGDHPLYVVRHGMLPPPAVPGFTFTAAGDGAYRLVLPGDDQPGHPGVPATTVLLVRVFRVERNPPG